MTLMHFEGLLEGSHRIIFDLWAIKVQNFDGNMTEVPSLEYMIIVTNFNNFLLNFFSNDFDQN